MTDSSPPPHPPGVATEYLTIRPAQPSELPEVLAVLDDAAAWLQRTGITQQWPPVISQDAGWVERVTGLVRAGEYFLAQSSGSTVGVFNLRDAPGLDGGPSVWYRPEELQVPACYLFTLALRRGVAGQGVAASMLQWAFDAARRRGRLLRLDCWAGNQKLRRYYLDAGFDHMGDIEGTGVDGRYYSVSRFQRSR